MSVPASILSLFVLLAALGFGYMLIPGDDVEQERMTTEAVVDDMAAPPAQDQTSLLQGSADRRMDDFGQGPSGKTVTMPLRDRYRQAYTGTTNGAGGGLPSRDLSEGQGSEGQARYRIIDREPAPGNDMARSVAGDDAVAGDRPDELETKAPSFDIVRVDPAGRTILAGRASPFADVEVLVGGEVLDRVKATSRGEWVSTPVKALDKGDQEISLVAGGEGELAIPSRQVVVVSTSASTEREVAEVDKPVAVLLDKEKSGEGRVLQAPGTLETDGELALTLVDYNDEGAIKLSGEAPPGTPVRIYIDNEPTALVIGDSKGNWIATLDRDLPGGDYTLRLDQLDQKGQTVARLETPFTRVATPPVEGQSKVDYVVVQPGNSLWRIARRLSGDGFNYVYLFEANQGQIKDPNIIYPGQVFEVPKDGEEGVAG